MNEPRFEVVDAPFGGRRGKYADIVYALLALPEGKALRVSRDVFPGKYKNQPEEFLKMKRRYGRACHYKTLPDGVYVWLDPVSANGKGGAQ